MSDYNWDTDPLIVPATDGYEPYDVDVWSCLACGSLVRGLWKEKHLKWHRYVNGDDNE